MDREALLAALMARDDPASQRAAAAIQRGVRIFEGWGSSAPLTLAKEFSANDEDGWEDPKTEVFGHENSMSSLRACPLPMVETVSLEDMPKERWFIHLDPESREVVACHGVVIAPNPPTVVHERKEVPYTVNAVAAAFRSYRRVDGEEAPFDVTVRRQLDSNEAQELYRTWPRRNDGWYKSARKISVLGAAEITCAHIVNAPFAPTVERFEGYLLILDVAPDPEVKRHKHGRVDGLLLTTNSRGALGVRVVMPFYYRAG
jgi:hypothetical protein